MFLSVFLTPGHSCKHPCLPALPQEDTSLLPGLSAWYNLTLLPPHSEGLASKENQINLVTIHPGKRVAKQPRTPLLTELGAEGGWQGVFFVCCPAPPRCSPGPWWHRGSCHGKPESLCLLKPHLLALSSTGQCQFRMCIIPTWMYLLLFSICLVAICKLMRNHSVSILLMEKERLWEAEWFVQDYAANQWEKRGSGHSTQECL